MRTEALTEISSLFMTINMVLWWNYLANVFYEPIIVLRRLCSQINCFGKIAKTNLLFILCAFCLVASQTHTIIRDACGSAGGKHLVPQSASFT